MEGKAAFFLMVVLLLALAGAAYYFYGAKSVPESGWVACTQEALLCPDGSYVSRHGSRCAFDSCPGTGPFSGKLEQTTSGFRLLMESPDKSGMEVTYSLPLEIKISNVLAQFVGQRVEVFGTFGEGITFKVERLEEAPISDATLGEVSAGGSVFINGVRITLNKIVQDSRCPIDVQCVQAGSVIANVTLKSDTDTETRNIESGKPPVSLDSFMISMENVKPPKIAARELDPQSYILTFRVISR